MHIQLIYTCYSRELMTFLEGEHQRWNRIVVEPRHFAKTKEHIRTSAIRKIPNHERQNGVPNSRLYDNCNAANR